MVPLKKFNLIVVAAILPSAFTSCVDERQSDVVDGGKLSAVKVYQVISRAVPPNSNFDAGTKYRLWAYENYGQGNGGYIFSDAAGIVGTESATHYVELDKDKNSKLRGNLNIYGITDGSGSISEPDAGTSPESPKYTIKYNGSETPKGESTRNYIYPDYMRSMLNYNSSTSTSSHAILEFKHVMSQVNVQVLQQDKDGKESRYDLRLKNIAIKGIYDEETYDVVSDKFSVAAGAEKQAHTIWRSSDADGEPVVFQAKELVQTLVFPTTDADRTSNTPISLVLEVGGDDAAQFLTDGKVEVPIMDNKNGSGTPLFFDSNYSYTIQVAFIGGEVRIITLVPQVYPWFDGETEKGDDYDSFHDQDLGNLALFDNLVWSQFNEGADISDPTDDDFEKVTMFAYIDSG